MRLNPLIAAYWLGRAAGAVYRRFGIICATQIHVATLKSVGKGSRFQSGVRFADPRGVRVGKNCYFWKGCNASSELPGTSLHIGDHVQVNRNVHLDITGGLRIGDGSMISEDAVIYTHDHGLDPHAPPQPRAKEIGADVWIGMRAVILPQCTQIGRGAVIGAGAVVATNVAANTVVAGNPARVIGQRLPMAQAAE
ncbi:acyltransferase [Yoonia sp. I 8.24]|uniref:acyltransferase n=1 Tax=Yoonia sp. I 8.24 TaxID=1537229 RepID=UPI001EE13D0D|nr:acyltransferase [Yoonia sp. I 8.24]MCG3267013.1 acyltransferase [Yoonia sp. I 8.24]